MEETKRLLVENSHLPMSIILVGVGRGDMSKMDILDDDNRTMSWNGRRSERDIVQFVEMSKYLPDQCLDPFTFHSVMDAANAKYHLARVRSRNSWIIDIPSPFLLMSPQDVLAEIPSQVVQYFERRGIRPGVPDVNVSIKYQRRIRATTQIFISSQDVQRRLRNFAFKDP